MYGGKKRKDALYNKPCASRNSIEIISLEEKNARSNSLIVACKKNFVLLFELAGLPRYRSGALLVSISSSSSSRAPLSFHPSFLCIRFSAGSWQSKLPDKRNICSLDRVSIAIPPMTISIRLFPSMEPLDSQICGRINRAPIARNCHDK